MGILVNRCIFQRITIEQRPHYVSMVCDEEKSKGRRRVGRKGRKYAGGPLHMLEEDMGTPREIHGGCSARCGRDYFSRRKASFFRKTQRGRRCVRGYVSSFLGIWVVEMEQRVSHRSHPFNGDNELTSGSSQVQPVGLARVCIAEWFGVCSRPRFHMMV